MSGGGVRKEAIENQVVTVICEKNYAQVLDEICMYYVYMYVPTNLCITKGENAVDVRLDKLCAVNHVGHAGSMQYYDGWYVFSRSLEMLGFLK